MVKISYWRTTSTSDAPVHYIAVKAGQTIPFTERYRIATVARSETGLLYIEVRRPGATSLVIAASGSGMVRPELQRFNFPRQRH
jgi:hypothetical protein